MASEEEVLEDTLRDQRYCEVIPSSVDRELQVVVSTVYNTVGLNNCPPGRWQRLEQQDPLQLALSLDAFQVKLNGPRHFVMDAISSVAESEPEQRIIGGIPMTLRATLETAFGAPTVGDEFYAPSFVQRDTEYTFNAGLPVYELVDPHGNVYTMQSYAQISDPTLSYSDLATLGERLAAGALPEGWTYRERILDSTLVLKSEGGTCIINDELYNTYQQSVFATGAPEDGACR